VRIVTVAARVVQEDYRRLVDFRFLWKRRKKERGERDEMK
jgi:hypothetical protein